MALNRGGLTRLNVGISKLLNFGILYTVCGSPPKFLLESQHASQSPYNRTLDINLYYFQLL